MIILGIFVEDSFEATIRKTQSPDDLIHNVTSMIDEARRGNGAHWLRIDGSFNGIHLEDFKYLSILGEVVIDIMI